jgi:anaerobic selenocysteine-containing dehydrogenase
MRPPPSKPLQVGDAVRVEKERGTVVAVAVSKATGRELVQVAFSPRVRIWLDRDDVRGD